MLLEQRRNLFIELLNDSEEEVRAAAAAALERLESFQDLGQIVEDSPGTPQGLFARFCVAALRGDRDGTIAAMTPELEVHGQRDLQFSWMIGSCYAMLGMVDEAVAWLRQAMKRGFINYPFLAEQEPFLARIRSQPQFQEVMEEVKQRWEEFEP